MLISIFMQILDMTRIASVVIVVVLLARLLLKRLPKVVSYALWAVVLFRLLCPLSIESPVSIMPEITPIESAYTLVDVPITPASVFEAAYGAMGDALNGGLGIQHIRTELTAEGGKNVSVVTSAWWEVWILFGQYAWLAGVFGMAIYAAVSYARLRRKLLTTLPLRDNIWTVDEIISPFVMGLFRPRIYLPSAMEEREQTYIILHEQHHIRRGDHWWKALAFLALCLHWFNPLVWVAFIMAGKDMEMSCDEAVIKKMGEGVLADYTASLLSLATGRHIIAGMPLAFGEGDTKGRIRNLANWKKPAFWVFAVGVIVCIVLAVVLLTNPSAPREFSGLGGNVSELEPQKIVGRIAEADHLGDLSLHTNADNFSIRLTSNFDMDDTQVIRFFYKKGQKTYSSQLAFDNDGTYRVTQPSDWPEQNRVYMLQSYLKALKYLPQEDIRALSPDADRYLLVLRDGGTPDDYDRSITYTPGGAGPIDGWLIHIEIQPLHSENDGGYFGAGHEVIHVFFSDGMRDSEQIYGVEGWFSNESAAYIRTISKKHGLLSTIRSACII